MSAVLVTRAGSLAHRMTGSLPTALPLASLNCHGLGSLGFGWRAVDVVIGDDMPLRFGELDQLRRHRGRDCLPALV